MVERVGQQEHGEVVTAAAVRKEAEKKWGNAKNLKALSSDLCP